MTDPRVPGRRRRRLAAILMADVVGFSKMMGRDDEGTTSRILDFHHGVRSLIEAHEGRVVGTAGDSVFGDFDSVVEALDCAVEIQRRLHDENADRAEEERVEVRMGLHIGDVIVEEYNVFGDGVNIASRLEQLADPGGIVLSEAVYQQVKGRRDLPFRDLGVRTLKNIDHPVHLYGLGADAYGGTPAPSPGRAADAARERSDVNRAVREALVEKVRGGEAEASLRRARDIVIRRRTGKGPWTRAVGPGTLVLLAIGVLLIVARTSGWSANGWYPFGGAVFVSLAVGRMARILTGRRGIRMLLQATGLAVGAFFLESVAVRAVWWVIAAAMLGTAIQAIARPEPDTGKAG